MNRSIALASVLLCLAASSYAADEPPPERTTPELAEAHQDGAGGNETAPPAKGRALSPQNRSVEGLQASVTTSGATKVDLEGRFQHALVLKIAPDGTRSVQCIDSAEHEAEMLKSTAQASEVTEKDED